MNPQQIEAALFAPDNLELEPPCDDMSAQPACMQKDYLIRYTPDIKKGGSHISIQRLAELWSCMLKTYDRKPAKARPKLIRMIETFNYLPGLSLNKEEGQEGTTRAEDENPQIESEQVIRRKLSGESDWPTTDNASQHAFTIIGLRVNPENSRNAAIHVNADTILEETHKKILLTEQVLHKLMFAEKE